MTESYYYRDGKSAEDCTRRLGSRGGRVSRRLGGRTETSDQDTQGDSVELADELEDPGQEAEESPVDAEVSRILQMDEDTHCVIVSPRNTKTMCQG